MAIVANVLAVVGVLLMAASFCISFDLNTMARKVFIVLGFIGGILLLAVATKLDPSDSVSMHSDVYTYYTRNLTVQS